jgi:hypothetical protein
MGSRRIARETTRPGGLAVEKSGGRGKRRGGERELEDFDDAIRCFDLHPEELDRVGRATVGGA